MKSWIAKSRVFYQRGSGYLNMAQAMMVAYLFAKQNDNGLMWILVAAIAWLAITWIDYHFIMSEESRVNFAKSPDLLQMNEKLDQLLRRGRQER